MSRAALAWTFAALALLLAVPAFAADTVYYYYTDTVHSAVAVTDAQGNVVERTTYYAPYGQVLNRGLRDGPGYTGHEEDPETDLVYMQQRYYDPEAGRFLSVDPVAATDTGGNFNRYAYASDNPYTYDDPFGEAATQASGRLADAGTSCQTGTHIGGGVCGALPLSVTQVGTRSVSEQRAAVAQQLLSRSLSADNVGKKKVGSLSKILTNEIGSLSSPKGQDPGVLRVGATAIADALINTYSSSRPNPTAPDIGVASRQLANLMQNDYLNRSTGGLDLDAGRTFYGTSHTPPSRLHSRPIGRGRQSVYSSFGPFNDSTSTQQTYIYIYNNPGH